MPSKPLWINALRVSHAEAVCGRGDTGEMILEVGIKKQMKSLTMSGNQVQASRKSGNEKLCNEIWLGYGFSRCHPSAVSDACLPREVWVKWSSVVTLLRSGPHRSRGCFSHPLGDSPDPWADSLSLIQRNRTTVGAEFLGVVLGELGLNSSKWSKSKSLVHYGPLGS